MQVSRSGRACVRYRSLHRSFSSEVSKRGGAATHRSDRCFAGTAHQSSLHQLFVGGAAWKFRGFCHNRSAGRRQGRVVVVIIGRCRHLLMSQPLACMKPASAFLTASAREHAADERPASGPSQSMHVRTLGWHIESSTAEDLFSRLYAAVASMGTMQLSGDSFGSLIFTATVLDGPPACGQPSSQEPMTALLWVVPSTTGHHVCIRRASGDTFIYHNFYRKVRQATAACQKRVFVSASRLLALPRSRLARRPPD